MNVVDSSGWLEYFAAGPNVDFFAPAIEDVSRLIVPVVSIYEVFKHVLQQRSEDPALQVVVAMQQGRVVDLDVTLALSAAKLSVDMKLPMADSITLACARAHGAMLWTQDADSQGIEGVRYVARA